MSDLTAIESIDTSLIQRVKSHNPAAEFMIQAIAGAFAGLYDRITYQNTTLDYFGNEWWIGCVFILFASCLSAAVRYYMGEPIRRSIVLSVLLVIIYTILSLIFNSLWRYGVFLYLPYLTDPQAFFGSDVLVGIIVSMGAVMFINLLPSRFDRFKLIESVKKRSIDTDDKCCYNECIFECEDQCKYRA